MTTKTKPLSQRGPWVAAVLPYDTVLPSWLEEAATGPTDCPRCCEPGTEVDRANGVTIYACDRLNYHEDGQPVRWSRADGTFQMPMNKAKHAPKAYRDSWREAAEHKVKNEIRKQHPTSYRPERHWLDLKQVCDDLVGKCQCGYETSLPMAEFTAAVEEASKRPSGIAGQYYDLGGEGG